MTRACQDASEPDETPTDAQIAAGVAMLRNELDVSEATLDEMTDLPLVVLRVYTAMRDARAA